MKRFLLHTTLTLVIAGLSCAGQTRSLPIGIAPDIATKTLATKSLVEALFDDAAESLRNRDYKSAATSVRQVAALVKQLARGDRPDSADGLYYIVENLDLLASNLDHGSVKTLTPLARAFSDTRNTLDAYYYGSLPPETYDQLLRDLRSAR
jgi:hypothetical protein